MPKKGKKGAKPVSVAEDCDWMVKLRLDKKGFTNLSKKIKMAYSPHYPIPDPTQRLIVTLRYLVMGEG